MAPKPLATSRCTTVAKAKASIRKKTNADDQVQRTQFMSTLACGFRNTMKYRMSEQCVKAICCKGALQFAIESTPLQACPLTLPIHHYPIHPSTNPRSNAPHGVAFQEHCSLWNCLPCTIVLFTLGQLCVNTLLANVMTLRLHQKRRRRHHRLWHSMTFSLTMPRGRGSQLERAIGHRTIVSRTINQYRA